MYLSINRGRKQKEGAIFPVSSLMLKFNLLPLNKPGPLPGIDIKIFCGKSNVFLLPIIFQKCRIGGQVAHCKFLESISGPSHSLQFFVFYICLFFFFIKVLCGYYVHPYYHHSLQFLKKNLSAFTVLGSLMSLLKAMC